MSVRKVTDLEKGSSYRKQQPTHLNQQTQTFRFLTGTSHPLSPKSPELSRNRPLPFVVLPSGNKTTGAPACAQSSSKLNNLPPAVRSKVE
jgi:hypothetical protein